MDDYIEHFYHSSTNARSIDVGNLTERFQVKSKLQCKSFQWYLEEVYVETYRSVLRLRL